MIAALAVVTLIAQRPAAAPPLERIARSPGGMVVTGSAFATQAGARVLAEGGNAVDAAVAAAFVLAVVEPSMSGIGGRTQLLICPAAGDCSGFDGATQIPASYAGATPIMDDSAFGYGTIAVPGTVAALTEALRTHGTWPLARVVTPAIDLAEHGFLLPEPEARRIASVAARLAESDGARRYFLKPNGEPFRSGERLRQPDLARTLRLIATRGADGFYRGEVAQRIAGDMAARGGHVTAADLSAYRVEPAVIVRGRYRGYELIGTYLPASGATTIEVMQILEHFDLPAFAGSPRWVAVVAQALLRGFEDRNAAVEPPARKAAWLTSRERAAEQAAQVRDPGPAGIPAPVPARAPGSPPPDTEPEHTTHLSVADRQGLMVALTQSLGPTMGAKVAAPGLGFLYAATMGYLADARPGARPYSSQSPLVVRRDGQPVYVLGAAGARRILSAIVQTLSRGIDEQVDFEDASAAPRFHVVDTLVYLESRPAAAWSEAEIDAVRRYGFAVRPRRDAPYFARINGIAFDRASGEWIGVADARWAGAAAGPR